MSENQNTDAQDSQFQEELEKYADAIYSNISKLEVELDHDPLVNGPAALNKKTAVARNFLTSATHMHMEVSNHLRSAKRQLIYEEGILDAKIKDIVINDKTARGYSSIKEREYYAQLQHKEGVTKLNNLKQYVQNLEFLLEAIKLKIADLKDVQVRIQNQVRLCQDELSTGNKWGNHANSLKDEKNANKYLEFKKSIQQRKDNEILISSKDNGCPIPEILLPMNNTQDSASNDILDDVDAFLNS